MTAAATYINPNTIDQVTVDHIEGSGSANRAFGISWKSRYWLAISTDTGNSRLIYVKARNLSKFPDAWTVFDNIPIGALAKDKENTLYAGSSSTGVFYRLDYGTNDNGTATDFYYETPDLTMGENWYDKDIQFALVEGEKVSGSSITISRSVDQGTTWKDSIVDTGGTGIYRKVVEGITENTTRKAYRFRFRSNSLDKPFTFNAFSVRYKMTDKYK